MPRTAWVGSYFTRHRCTPAATFGWKFTSRRNALVETGLKLTLLYRSLSTAHAPAPEFAKGFQSVPSLYRMRHEAGTRTPPRGASSNQYSSDSLTVAGLSNAYSIHPLVAVPAGHQSK